MKKLAIFLVLALNLFALDATMEIIKDTQNLPKVKVQPLYSDGYNRLLGDKTAALLVGDLKVSGHFDAYMGGDTNSTATGAPNFAALKQNGVDLLAKVGIEKEGGNTIANYELYDINLKKSVEKKRFSVQEASRYPFLSHKIAISINDYLAAPTIAWMDRFVTLSRLKGKKAADIVIADYTLTFQKSIVIGGLNVFPKWANKEQTKIYYTSLTDIPTLYLIDIFNGQRKQVLQSQGMMVCSDVSEDGSKLLVTMAKYNDQPDIFLYNTANGKLNRITSFQGIDVGGHFVDNETRVAFISDRLGNPNIYATRINGSGGVEQLVYHGKNNVSLTAFKNYIAYSSRESNSEFERNTFNLYLISTQSNFIRRLTAEGVNEFPTFSRDGESILFIKNLSYQSSLGIIRLNYNKSFVFPLKDGKIQSIDW